MIERDRLLDDLHTHTMHHELSLRSIFSVIASASGRCLLARVAERPGTIVPANVMAVVHQVLEC
jgi:hypothetical protein